MPRAAASGTLGRTVICVRGPSRSGKTSVCERLIPWLAERGVRAAWVKRTHHALDLPHKASERVWSAGPVAMAVATDDRTQVTLPPGAALQGLLDNVAAGSDVILLETHSPEDYPAIVSEIADAVPGERVLARWTLDSLDASLPAIGAAVLATLPADLGLARALRAASSLHGGHGCAGVVLGTRLALGGVGALGLEWPDTNKRLLVIAETDRCAVDAIQAVTGCRPGRRTLRILDYGKLAATFVDTWSERAVRVAVRGDVRERVDDWAPASIEDRHDRQREAYLRMPPHELFHESAVPAELSQHDLPGPPRRRVRCARCTEEVSDGRDVATDAGPLCHPCAHQEQSPIPGGSQ